MLNKLSFDFGLLKLGHFIGSDEETKELNIGFMFVGLIKVWLLSIELQLLVAGVNHVFCSKI